MTPASTMEEERNRLRERMAGIRHKVLVLSGKGGVGKSTVAVNLAAALAARGLRVGLLDVDIHGPSVPGMLGLEAERVLTDDGDILPVAWGELRVMSIGFLVENPQDALIWRGPMKMNVIQQFLRDVRWGALDVLVVDAPPGTGDEPLSVCQLLNDADGALIVTTPQEVALRAVRRSISFCRRLEMPVLGVVENMSGFVCPHCGEESALFPSGGAEKMAAAMDAPFLARLPVDPAVAQSGEAGAPAVIADAQSPAARAFAPLVDLVNELAAPEAADTHTDQEQDKPRGDIKTMKIAVPVADGLLSMHFGHCDQFELIDVDMEKKEIVNTETLDAPPHQPGLLPRWLHEKGANMIIAGGMGSRAQGLFAQQDIQVLTGAPSDSPQTLVQAYLAGTLETGGNVCDH